VSHNNPWEGRRLGPSQTSVGFHEENPVRGPGKFGSDLDAYLYELSMDADEEAGNIDENGYWVGLLVNLYEATPSDAEQSTWQLLDIEEHDKLDNADSAVILEDSNGFVWVWMFPTDDEGQEKFDSIVDKLKL